MNPVEIRLDSTDDTARFGALLASLLLPGDVLLLSGELGAGKTTLVRAIAAEAGVDPRQVSSPTFTVLHEYTPPAGPVIVHADAYRLAGDDEAELDLLGWDHALAGGAIVLIEWGERIAELIDTEYATITIHHEGESQRLVLLDAPASWTRRDGWRPLLQTYPQTGDTPPGFPFASEREQYADLYRWFNESYRVSRPVDETDLDQS